MLHPLEPLSTAEVSRAISVLAAAGSLTPTTRVVSVMLKEPPKAAVHAGTGWEKRPREAAAILFDNATNSCFEAEVNLAKEAVTAFKHVPGVQPTMTIDEQAECEQAVIKSPEFAAALKKHCGIDDTRLVMVDIWSAGYYGEEADKGKRLARPLCFLRSDPTDNGYVRPIEGIRPVVDLNTMKVIRVEEFGPWPLPPGECNYSAGRVPNLRTDIKPLTIDAARARPGFQTRRLPGGFLAEVESLVIGFNAREGLNAAPPGPLQRQGPQGAARSCTAHRSRKWSSLTPTRRRRRRGRTRLTWASTGWGCVPIACGSAATASGTSSISTPTCATVAGSR